MTNIEREAIRNRSLTTLKNITAQTYVCLAHSQMNTVVEFRCIIMSVLVFCRSNNVRFHSVGDFRSKFQAFGVVWLISSLFWVVTRRIRFRIHVLG